ncbi:MAG TPA: CDP-diacylglycerol--glycerol-3-phosphate 3-phosphatidyltransferase [Deltaproteobacteria bacterium]|nr:CDP-diacylglycerol--glycerol-3-phosphate 3-phosphatidyltransferase [Deltaproteobacteria bacterium]
MIFAEDYYWTYIGEITDKRFSMRLRSEKKREYFNLPNYLTLGRIVMIPAVLFLIARIDPAKGVRQNLTMGIAAAAVFLIASISDLIDGYYARKHQINGVFGKYFDPLADKLLILAAMIMLIPLGRIPAWMAVLFLAREITVTALRGMAASEELILPADYWGKKKAVLQTAALLGLMIYYPVLGIDFGKVGWILLILSLIIAVGSGVNYALQFARSILERYR